MSRCGDRAREAGRDLVVQVDQPVGVRLEVLGVRCLAPLVRHVLGEQREDVGAVGVHRLVERGRDDAVAEGQQRGAALAGVLERPLDELHGRRHFHRPSVVLGHDMGPAAGIGREVGQLGQGEVDLDHAGAGVPALDVGHEVGGELGAREVVEEGDLRVQAGDDERRGELLAGLEHDAGDVPVAGADRVDPRVGAELGAEGTGAARRSRPTPRPCRPRGSPRNPAVHCGRRRRRRRRWSGGPSRTPCRARRGRPRCRSRR